MIVTEFFRTREDGVDLMKTYSNAGKLIRQVETGAIYSEAIDVSPLRYTYEETEDDIPPEDENVAFQQMQEENEDMRNALSILGVNRE